MVTTTVVRDCERHLTQFLEHYLPLFYLKEQRVNATIEVEGLLSGLKRKTCEPIAREHGVERKPIQFFVGAGKWDDEKVMAELHSMHGKKETRIAVSIRMPSLLQLRPRVRTCTLLGRRASLRQR